MGAAYARADFTEMSAKNRSGVQRSVVRIRTVPQLENVTVTQGSKDLDVIR